MTAAATPERRAAFAAWLRTGRLPVARGPDGIELKFNPWHDPDDGQFTFAGSGRQYGAGQSASAGATGRTQRVVYRDDPAKPRIGSRAEADAWRSNELARNGNKRSYRAAIEARHRQYVAALASVQP